jgi:flagellar basal-body rod protein FlgF
MEVSLYQAAAAMNATAQWQEMIAENLTTASIAGGRKHDISFQDVQAGMDPNAASGSQSAYFIPTAQTLTNFQPGELHASSNPMDFALDGPGYFTIQMPNGQNAYTRGGEFQLNAKGQLVTNQGYPVLGEGGPLQFNPNSSDFVTISPTGEVSQGAQQVGHLKVTEFKNPQYLTMIGANEFRSDSPDAQATPATSTKVRQGFLEAANASPTTEMSGLVTAMRMFEANQKVMQMQSDRMSRTITELGGTS